MTDQLIYPEGSQGYTVYVDVVARKASVSGLLVCTLAFIIWLWSGLIIINPIVNVLAWGASAMFFMMSEDLKTQRLNTIDYR
jgi:hypothetical protein